MKKRKVLLRDLPVRHSHEGHNHNHDDGDGHSPNSFVKTYLPAAISLLLLASGMVMDFSGQPFFKGSLRGFWYLAAYLPVAAPVLWKGWKSIRGGELFTEFFLMSVATLGAFALGEYPEGVAVMLFYAVGELFQEAAVKRAKENIRALLDVRPREALLYQDGDYVSVNPETVPVGGKVQVRVGEKIPLDGTLLSDRASVNTAAITGESKPETRVRGDAVYGGSINLEGVIEIETTKKFQDSSIARIMELVQHATARKSRTELFIRKFARIYTPIVVFLAIGLTFLPYLFLETYEFGDWLYRALIFLVISCPCALVISIPLGYFGGLGAASRNGILFKGASFLDSMTRVNTVVLDKTGTVTKGVFRVRDIVTDDSFTEGEFMQYLMAMEAQSTHPIAKAIREYQAQGAGFDATEVSEVAGKGLKGRVNGKSVLAGNKALMTANGIEVPSDTDGILESIVLVAIAGKFAGYVVIADELKEDARQAIREIREAGISKVIMLSGDKDAITRKVSGELDIDWAKGGMLPEDKLREVEELKKQPDTHVAFVGDGINDAPVLAASDVGIAMGGLGSDVAIETADVVIQTDQPARIGRAIRIARATRRIVWQNIGLAFGVKAVVLLLGAWGVAGMWEAVFADVGVALLAILNAVRLQRMRWE